MTRLAALVLLIVGCGETSTVATYSYPRLRITGAEGASRVTLHLRVVAGDALAVLGGVVDRDQTCPCDGRSVDVAVPSGVVEPWVIGVAWGSDGRATARGAIVLDGSTGERTLPLLPITCQDADGDGSCGDEAPPLDDCDDTDSALGPLLGCATTPPPDVVDPDTGDTPSPPADHGSDDVADTPIQPDVPAFDDVADVAEEDVGTDVATDADIGADTSLLGFGVPCQVNDQCASGACVYQPFDTVCSEACEGADAEEVDTCPSGFECRNVPAGLGDPLEVCLSAFQVLCTPCLSSADCIGFAGAETCVEYPDGVGSFCGGSCAAEGCPGGFACDKNGQCVAEDGVCPCPPNAVTSAASTACSITSEFGTCDGQRTCTETGLSACDAATPLAETCDESDNDCDGAIDEGIVCSSEPCPDSDPEACAGGDPCMQVVCDDALCGLVPRVECFGAGLVWVGVQPDGCRMYSLETPLGSILLCRVPRGLGLRGSGADAAEPSERPEHLVWEPSFFLMRTEVTEGMMALFVADYAGLVGGGTLNCGQGPPAHWVGEAVPDGEESHPTRGVCWQAAFELCEAITLALPSESQWERAARGVNGPSYPWGEAAADTALAQVLAEGTAPVGTHGAGASVYGVHDLVGNVAEWVADLHDPDAYCAVTGALAGCSEPGAVVPEAPVNAGSSGDRVVRGGSWDSLWTEATSWRRTSVGQSVVDPEVGIRCALTSKAVATSPMGCCSSGVVEVAGGDGSWTGAGPSAAPGPAGGIAVVWAEDSSLRLRRFDDNGGALGPSVELHPLSGVSYDGSFARTVEQLAGGDLLVVWEEDSGTIRHRRFQPDGTPLGAAAASAFVTAKSSFAGEGGVARWDDGAYAICASNGVTVALFSADGTPVGDPIPVPTSTADTQRCTIATLDDDSLVVAWQATGQTGLTRRVSKGGQILGPEYTLGTNLGAPDGAADSYLQFPAVGAARGGRVVYAWSVSDQDISAELRALDGTELPGQYGAVAVASPAHKAADPFRVRGGAGPWTEIWWTESNDLRRRVFRVTPDEKLAPLVAIRTLGGGAAGAQSLRSVRRDRHGRWVVTWTTSEGQGALQVLRD